MTVSAIVVDVPPDPAAVADRLAERPGFAFLHRPWSRFRAGASYVACDPVERCSTLLPDIAVNANGRDTRAPVPRWIGVVPYECARSLERPSWTRYPDSRPAPHVVEPIWLRYGAVVEIDPARSRVRVVGDDRDQVERLSRLLRTAEPHARPVPSLSAIEEDDPQRAHVDRVRRAKQLIMAGDLYQVNLARRLRFVAEGRPLDIYLSMAEQTAAPFGLCLDAGGIYICASSPELFLSLAPDGSIRTSPIKGTRPRGVDAAEDLRLVAELDESVKERAELSMILDVERNDVGKVATVGSVRVLAPPSVETLRSIHHRAATIAARLGPGQRPLDLMRAAFPSGSVTGAPKVRAMEVIAELEPVRRGLYTGAFGTVSFGGALTLAMAIRVLTIRGREAHYFAGGGIVADSDPELELSETRWKAGHLAKLCKSKEC